MPKTNLIELIGEDLRLEIAPDTFVDIYIVDFNKVKYQFVGIDGFKDRAFTSRLEVVFDQIESVYDYCFKDIIGARFFLFQFTPKRTPVKKELCEDYISLSGKTARDLDRFAAQLGESLSMKGADFVSIRYNIQRFIKSLPPEELIAVATWAMFGAGINESGLNKKQIGLKTFS